MTDRLISEEHIGRALRAQADEAVRAFDPTEIARLAAGTGWTLPLPWASLLGRQSRQVRWAVLAAVLLLLTAITSLVGASLLRGPTPLAGPPLFVAQMVCDASCSWPTGIRASTIDPQTGQSFASWDLPFISTTLSGPSVEPAWSPDRRHVLLYDWNNQLVAIADVVTGTLATPPGDDPTGITGYAWGPESDRIARVSGGHAEAIVIDDLALHQLERIQLPDGAMIDSRPAWSPNGSELVVTGCLPCDTSWKGSPPTPNQRRLFVIPVDGSPVRGLPITSASQMGMSAWSPDGRSVALGTVAGIWTIDVSDGEQRAVTSGPAGDPHWSPDGSHLVFGSTSDAGLAGIVMVDADGGRRTPLTSGADSRPQWSPDGLWIVFSRAGRRSDVDPRPGDIMIIPAAGGEPRLLSTGATAGW